MRGEGQIAELVAIAEPDVGVIVNVGPVHLELLGTVERVAAAKAELIRDLRAGRRLRRARQRAAARRRTCATTLDTWTFGPGGEVRLLAFDAGRAEIEARERDDRARAAATPSPTTCSTRWPRWPRRRALGRAREAAAWTCASRRCAARSWSSPGGVTVVNDCYNANPMSMRAALDHLAESAAERRMAVLGGDGRAGRRLGRATTARSARTRPRWASTCWCRWARRRSPTREGSTARRTRWRRPRRPAALLEELAQPGDRVLIKGSRSVGLERVLRRRPDARRDPDRGHGLPAHLHVPGAALHRVPAPQGVRPADPRGGPAGHHGKAGTPTMGGLVILAGRLRAVPDPVRLPRRQPVRARARRWRWRGARASPTT